MSVFSRFAIINYGVRRRLVLGDCQERVYDSDVRRHWLHLLRRIPEDAGRV